MMMPKANDNRSPSAGPSSKIIDTALPMSDNPIIVTAAPRTTGGKNRNSLEKTGANNIMNSPQPITDRLIAATRPLSTEGADDIIEVEG